ncbi:MAG TPA: molybdopterin cofactor-binding domain-containing protein, partial [Thermoanaerobaculia bacterium]|nr:molybdopterin cofactor-binding domain-containing protein [Thermoanaerobaculia bacterium]
MTLPLIGEPRDRVDGRVKVTGAARFAAENNMEGLLHAVVVPATIASGRITAIDDAAARKAPGVLAVITYRNAPKLNPPPAQTTGQNQAGGQQSGGGGQSSANGQQQQGGKQQASAPPPATGNYAEPHLMPLAGPEVHYLGQQIAVVVATTLEQATHAANLVRVTYEATPARIDLQAYRAEGTDKGSQQAPPIHAGDADTAFAAAPVKVDQTYRTPYEHHNPMEAHALVAAWNGNRLTVHDSSQNIFGVRVTLSQAFGIPREYVQVL